MILEHVLADRWISIPQLSQETGLSIGSVHKILRKDLRMSRICAKFVPRLLSMEEKTNRILCCQEWIQMTQDDGDLINRIVTGDESWVWAYDPETKKESSQWIRRHVDNRPEKALRACSTKKLMILPFFDIKGFIHIEFVKGTIKSEDYIEILMTQRPNLPQTPATVETTQLDSA